MDNRQVVRQLEALVDNGSRLDSGSVHQKVVEADHGDVCVVAVGAVAGVVDDASEGDDDTTSTASRGTGTDTAVTAVEEAVIFCKHVFVTLLCVHVELCVIVHTLLQKEYS